MTNSSPSTRGHNPMMTLSVVVASVFAYKGLESVLSPAIPIVQESLGATEAEIAWVLTAVLLTGAVATPLIGRLADIRNKKTVLLWVLGIVAVGVAISGLSVSVPMLTVGQLLQGIGLGVVPLAFGIIRDTQTEERVKSGNGAVIGFIYAGTGFAIVGSGVLVTLLPWRWLFCVPFAIIVVIFLASWKLVPSCPPVKRGSVDWAGAALLGSSMAVLLIGITEAPEWGWLSTKFGGAVATSAALLAAFTFVELRSREPLVDLRILATRPLAVSCLIYLMCGFSVNMMFLTIPMLAQQSADTGFGLAASAFTTSLILLPIGLVGAAAAPVTGWLDAHIGSRATLLVAIIANGAAFTMLLVANGSFLLVILGSTLVGASGGVALTQAMNIVALTSPASRIGAFSGLAFVVKAVGGTLGVQISGSVMTTGSQGGTPSWSSFVIVFGIGIAVTVGVAAACLLLPRRTTHLQLDDEAVREDERTSVD
ncbi:MFS transporter [Rhodococcus sp. NPDC056960]|uniref:MFS transporter n=1 Tax=Rhodococcus sp. NPDC056960 TaxID=3345982 RepID=UPI0036319CEE